MTDSYLGATDTLTWPIEQRTLREEMAGLGYVNTKLVGVMYYDREEKKELISGMNVRRWTEAMLHCPRLWSAREMSYRRPIRLFLGVAKNRSFPS